jgi:internalin A
MALASLECAGTPVFDLSPLEGMKKLEALNISRTRVAELWRLEGMRLTTLNCAGTRVTDLSPLTKLRLEEVNCDVTSKQDRDALRAIPTLRTINGVSAAEWWRKEEAGKREPDR